MNIFQIGTGSNQDPLSKINSVERKIAATLHDPTTLLNQTKYGVYSSSWLQKMLNRPDPLVSFSWDCDLPEVGGCTLGSEYVEAFTPTFANINVDNYFRAGVSYARPGNSRNHDSIRLLFYADANNNALNYLRTWQMTMQAEDGYWNVSSAYRKTISFYAKDGNNGDIFGLHYKDSFLSSIGEPQFDAQSSRIVYEATFGVGYLTCTGFQMDTFSGAVQSFITSASSTFMNNAQEAARGGMQKIKESAMSWVSENVTLDRVTSLFS